MKLEVHERIALIGLLPVKGDYAALKTLRRAREMLSFTPEEQKFYELRTVPGEDGKPHTQWNAAKAAEQIKDCPVDEYITNLIRDKLSELNKKHKLTGQLLSVYDKFVVTYK